LEIDDLVIMVMGIMALKEEMSLIEEVIAKEDKINIYIPNRSIPNSIIRYQILSKSMGRANVALPFFTPRLHKQHDKG